MKTAVCLTLLFIATFLAYANTFSVPFLLDDVLTVTRNEAVQADRFELDLGSRGLLRWTFTLNHWISGNNVWSYHVLNLLLHVLNGFLVFWICQRILASWPALKSNPLHSIQSSAALAAGFFLLHPLQTESVTYISSRSELLSTNLYLAAFLLFVSVPHWSIGFGLSLGVGVLFFLGLGAKETVITLPMAMLLYDWLFIRPAWGPIRSRWSFYITFVIGGVAAGWEILNRLMVSVGAGAEGTVPPWHYFLTQLRVLLRYIRLIVLPTGQTLDYDFPVYTTVNLTVMACAFALAGILVVAWHCRKDYPMFAFSIVWFFLTLAPTSSIVPIADVIFEHRMYLPLAGISLSIPLLFEVVYAQCRKRSDYLFQVRDSGRER